MIKIEITNPSTCDKDELRQVISLLQSFAGDTQKVEIRLDKDQVARLADVVKHTAATIAPEDNPATGTPDAREAFKGAAEQSNLDPAVAFGAKVPDVPAVATGFTTDPAAAFGAPGNVPAESSPTVSSNADASAPVPNTNHAPVPSGLTVELDKNGLPWDSRIHAGTKVKNADGSWRNRRGVDAGTLAQVEAELRGVMAVPAPNVPAAPVNIPPAPPVVTGPVVDTPTTNVVPSPAPAAHETVAPAPGAATMGYPELAQKITAALTAGTLTQDRLVAACAGVGIPAFPLLATRPDLVPNVAATLGLA